MAADFGQKLVFTLTLPQPTGVVVAGTQAQCDEVGGAGQKKPHARAAGHAHGRVGGGEVRQKNLSWEFQPVRWVPAGVRSAGREGIGHRASGFGLRVRWAMDASSTGVIGGALRASAPQAPWAAMRAVLAYKAWSQVKVQTVCHRICTP